MRVLFDGYDATGAMTVPEHRRVALVAERHCDAGSIGLVDETSFAKREVMTVGVARQYCGCRGTLDNCVVSGLPLHAGPPAVPARGVGAGLGTSPGGGRGVAERLVKSRVVVPGVT